VDLRSNADAECSGNAAVAVIAWSTRRPPASESVLAHDQTIRKGQPFRYSESCEHAVMGVPSECSSFRTKEAATQ